MKESLIGSVVGTVTGAVESTTSALTGTTTSTKDTSSSKTTSSTGSPSTSPRTSAPASTTSTPSSTSTSAPAATTSVPASSTPIPASSTATPSPASSPPSITAAGSASDSSVSVSSSTSSLTAATPTETAAAPSSSSASTSARDSSATYSTSASMSASGLSGSSSAQSSRSKEQSQTNVSLGNSTGSSSQGSDEAGIGVPADSGISTGSIVVLVLAALGVLLLCVLLATWCLRRSRRHLMSSVSHVQLGATGDIPVFNTRGTERFETSSTSVSFGHFDTALDQDAMSEGPRRSGLWDDEVIAAMRVPMEKLTTTKLLSSGGYGEVYRGLYREEPVAIKVLLPEKRKDLDQINAFLAEIKMMATIDHPCIVQFVAVAWDSPSDLSAVMEFMEGGDLRSLLDRFKQEQRPRGFDLDKARIALQTTQALTYLHSLDPKVLHRDLKSRNILLASSMNAKVSDFGIARSYSFTSMTAAVGTSLWMAPEVMLGDRYDTSADIFSFGIVLSELDSHLYPYAEVRMSNSGQRVPDAALLQLVAMGRVTINFSSNAPAQLVDLGRACVRLDPSARPSAGEVHYRLQLILQSYELYTV